MSKILYKYSEKFISKWLVLAMDVFICMIAFICSYVIMNNFDLTFVTNPEFKSHLFLVALVFISAFIYFNTNSGIVRHTSLEDGKLIFKAVLVSSVYLFLLRFWPYENYRSYFSIGIPIIIINFFICLFALFFSRLVVKSIYERILNNFKTKKKVIIYGAGNLGRITKSALLKDKSKHYEVLCFIDDKPSSVGKSLEGTKVLSKEVAFETFQKSIINKETEIIFAIQSINPTEKNDIIDYFLEKGVKLKIVPPVRSWINGELNIAEIQEIKIEDLLERETISINNRFVRESIENKVILISGAAGSIGSEIAKQVLKFNPKKLILIDQAESFLYDLESELKRLPTLKTTCPVHIEVMNITELDQLEKIFKKHSPDFVYHAAAYKHVPLMEQNPYQAIKVNVFGTKNIADLSNKYKVTKFVLVSTDKAVNPTNVMGATKRLAEMYVQSLNSQNSTDTRFTVTRFGNVLGSNGSVIPLFKRQIEKGGPVTVTDPEITRFFMTIPEACQLVLEASSMSKGGEVFVFDMGQPVKIVDLAKKMIKLSGFTLGKDMHIEFTELRPGEKLYEELLNTSENSIPTYHPKILIGKVNPEDFITISGNLKGFYKKIDHLNNFELVQELKRLVPEFISNNSPYENLDDNSELLSKKESHSN